MNRKKLKVLRKRMKPVEDRMRKLFKTRIHRKTQVIVMTVTIP